MRYCPRNDRAPLIFPFSPVYRLPLLTVSFREIEVDCPRGREQLTQHPKSPEHHPPPCEIEWGWCYEPPRTYASEPMFVDLLLGDKSDRVCVRAGVERWMRGLLRMISLKEFSFWGQWWDLPGCEWFIIWVHFEGKIDGKCDVYTFSGVRGNGRICSLSVTREITASMFTYIIFRNYFTTKLWFIKVLF